MIFRDEYTFVFGDSAARFWRVIPSSRTPYRYLGQVPPDGNWLHPWRRLHYVAADLIVLGGVGGATPYSVTGYQITAWMAGSPRLSTDLVPLATRISGGPGALVWLAGGVPAWGIAVTIEQGAPVIGDILKLAVFYD